MKNLLLRAILLASAALAFVAAPALAASPVPTMSPNPGASEVASTYASVKPDTGALAINTTSGSSVFALAFDLKFIDGSTVAPTNLAIAYSSCTACQTVAISIQVVIYQNGAANVSPQNAAVAINNLCNLCDTMAAAYQLAIGTSGPVRLTEDGREQIVEIRSKLAALQQQQGLTGAQIQAQVDILVAQLLHVLQTDLVPVKDEGERGAARGETGGNATVTLISPSPTSRPYSPPPSASPSASASVSPSPSATATQVSPSPTH